MIFVFYLPAVFLPIDFIWYLFKGKRLLNPVATRVLETVVMVSFAWLFLHLFDFGKPNDCCDESAVFSPEHRPTIYVWIAMGMGAFFYSRFRKSIAPPLMELSVNALLAVGILLNGLMAYHLEWALALLGNLPIALMLVMALMDNQRRILAELPPGTRLAAWLHSNAWLRYSLVLLFCLPALCVVTCLLLVFGQQPDAAVRAFTETYKHGFSQWDYMCESVQCGGHYLCTIAAKGHPALVRPLRYGRRGGGRIICNRQLLVSNAFEELIAQRLPRAHRWIRNRYDRVGDWVQGRRNWFANPYVADAVYLLMKPLEWVFLLVLYCCDRNPEDRIARQYADV